jgi:AcrR family transcriptional regulator
VARTQRVDLHERADALLDAAAALLTDAGPGALRIEEVAKRAGVGKGTVYLHWASREHLTLAVAAREAVAMLEAVIAAIRADPAEAALHRYLRRHFLEAMGRPVLKTVFLTDRDGPDAIADHSARSSLATSKLVAAHDYLAALRRHRLLRSGLDLTEVDYAVQAIAYGFFAAAPLLPENPRFTLEHQADQLAEVVRRSFEPTRPAGPERYSAAAPEVIGAFERLQREFHRTAYGTAAD